MRPLNLSLSALMLGLMIAGCTDPGSLPTSAPITIRTLSPSPASEQGECWENMNSLAWAQSMYYAEYDIYAMVIETLYPFVEDIPYCPTCSLEYFLESDGFTWWEFTCPMPMLPNHGTFRPADAHPPYQGPCEECRSRMRTIATAESMYYGEYDTYTAYFQNLWIVSWGLDSICPAGEAIYSLRGNDAHYAILCTYSFAPSHGSIIDGIMSWGE